MIVITTCSVVDPDGSEKCFFVAGSGFVKFFANPDPKKLKGMYCRSQYVPR